MTGSSRAPIVLANVEPLDEHDTGAAHPERSARLGAVLAGIDDAGLHDAVSTLPPRAATDDEIASVHAPDYLRALELFIDAGGGQLDPDTVAAPGSLRTARYAAGAGLAAIDALRAGDGDAAFVVIRPPGHHATADRAMGFCLLNNVAIGAAALAARGERVAVIDWDVHHGNGTQDIFWDDDRVLYVSTHEWPAYPGTGRAVDVGGPAAVGTTVNVPLPSGSTGDALRFAFDEIIAPAVEQFAPTWVLISAGFDAHRDDPLADLGWTAGDFADLASRVASFAPVPGRVVAYLEGGYDLDALALSAGATVAALAGEHWQPEPSSNGGPGRDHVQIAARLRSRAMEGAR